MHFLVVLLLFIRKRRVYYFTLVLLLLLLVTITTINYDDTSYYYSYIVNTSNENKISKNNTSFVQLFLQCINNVLVPIVNVTTTQYQNQHNNFVVVMINMKWWWYNNQSYIVQNKEYYCQDGTRQLKEVVVVEEKPVVLQKKNTTTNTNKKTIVLVMGLPHSGSESIHNYFTCNNIQSSHYCCYTSTGTTTTTTKGQKRYKRKQKQQKQSNKQQPRHLVEVVQQQQQQQQQQQRIRFPCSTTKTTANGNTNSFYQKHTNVIPCGQCVYNNVKYMQRQQQNNRKRTKQKIRQQRRPFDGCSSHSSTISNNNNNIIEVYSQFDVETSIPYKWFLPQRYLVPLLYESYKNNTNNNYNSIWILNYRTTSTIWVTNILHWYSITKRLLQSFTIEYYKYVIDTTVRVHGPQSNNNLSLSILYIALEKSYDRTNSIQEYTRRKQQLNTIYNNHIQYIRSFVKQYNQPYIELNVDNTIQYNQLLLDTTFQSYFPTPAISSSTTTTPTSSATTASGSTKNQQSPRDDDNDEQEQSQDQREEVNEQSSSKTRRSHQQQQKKQCWSYDASVLDNDWTVFSYPKL